MDTKRWAHTATVGELLDVLNGLHGAVGEDCPIINAGTGKATVKVTAVMTETGYAVEVATS